MRITAGIFLIRADGRVLIGHPTNHGPNTWSIPKGGVDDGESMLDGAIREMWEETNIDVSPCNTIHALPQVNYKTKKKTLQPYLIWENENSELDWNGFKIKCNSFVKDDKGGFPEMDAFKFVTLDEAMTLLHETQVSCIGIIKRLINERN